jgi:hypothetical protein
MLIDPNQSSKYDDQPTPPSTESKEPPDAAAHKFVVLPHHPLYGCLVTILQRRVRTTYVDCLIADPAHSGFRYHIHEGWLSSTQPHPCPFLLPRRRPFAFPSRLWIRWYRSSSLHLTSGGSWTMNKPTMHHLLPQQIQLIWDQLPQKSRTQLAHRLFFLALEKAGGISHEYCSPHALSRSPSQDSGSASQEIGRDLRAPIVAVAGRESPGESEASISVDRPGERTQLGSRSLHRH